MALVVSTTSKVSSGFDPRTIPDCALWLDAADRNTLTLSGSNVTQWNDKSGNGRNAIANVAGVYSNTSSGYALSFGGSNYYTFNNLSFAVGSYFSFFIVEKIQSGTTYHILGTDATGDNSSPHIRYNVIGSATTASSFRFAFYNNDLDANTGIPGFTTAATQPTRIWSLVFNNSFRGIYMNSTLLASDANNTQLVSWATPLLGRAFGGFYFNGFLYEILGYGGQITTAQRQQVEGYLARKWGLSSNLPATHLYRSIPIVTRGFQPIDIPDCALWLDAADRTTMTLSGSNVTSWGDKSGNGNNANAHTSYATLASNIQNGLPGLQFSGGQALSAGNIATGTNFSLFTVVRYTATGGNSMGFWKVQYSSSLFFNQSAGIAGQISATGGFGVTGFGISVDSNPHIVSGLISSDTVSSNGYLIGGLDGTVSQSNVTNGPNTSNCQSPFTVGALIESGIAYFFLTGYIHEIVFYRATLTTAQRRQIEGYLAAKWGLRTNLPSTHPFKLVPAVTPTFTPLQISGCQLWLDAADATTLTLSGSNVTQWNDKSGNGYNASGGISPAYSNSGVVFDGSTMSLLTSYTAQPTTETILLVCSFNASATTGGFPLGTTIHGGRSVNMGYSSGTVTVMWDKLGYWGNASSSASISAGTRFLTTMVLYNATNASTSLNAANQSSIATFPNSFFGGGTTRIGAALTSGSLYAQFYGTINEIIVYNSALSRSQYQQLEGYLAAKWGLKSSLPTTHPFKVITP
jgi:hypothetical protein